MNIIALNVMQKYIRIRKVDTNRMRCGHCNGKLRMKKTIEISTIQIELIRVYLKIIYEVYGIYIEFINELF